ncbi:MAG: permease prefix domain 1-containing protein [Planctomycetaceae bacterium]|nr:permease prefix domain 1-containing protein [Planctomycetaceae bacterium]
MSDHEFDNYLALLSRLLKLGKKQRDAIAGELRSHLEDRLEDLVARGVPRDEAVRQALEEFGDAAAMAAEFVSLSGNKRKRWIMRITTASVAAIVLIAAGIFTFWPGGNAGPGAAKLIAQAQQPDTKAEPAGDDKATEHRKAVAIKDVLDRRMAFDFIEKPLTSVANQLEKQTGITIYVNARKLEEAGVNVDTPITMAFPDMRFRTFLDLMLGELELMYLVKDDVLFITSQEDAESPDNMVARVYDCRELLALPRPPGSIRPKAAGAAPGSNATGGEGDSKEGGDAAQLEIADSENLIEVITTIVDPESWVDVGGPGAIVEYKGLVTIAATQDTHQKVERLLNMLHQAANLKELKVTVVE